MTAKLLPLVPRHHTYIEPFGGGASLLFAKAPSAVEVYNDIDSGLVNFFRVLRDPEQFESFYRLAQLTPYAREEYDHCHATWNDCDDPVERAYRWFVVARMSFSGRLGAGWGSAVTSSSRGMAATVSKWLSAINMLPQISERLLRVQIEHADWRTILDRYDTPDSFFYLDPPYVHETRSDTRYDHELSDHDHAGLVDAVLALRGKVMLSGYDHAVYAPLIGAGWTRIEWQTACSAAGRTRAAGLQGAGVALEHQSRTEIVWMNYERQPRLF